MTPDEAREKLDAQVREMMEWHFNTDTGSPFWLEKASTLGFDPRQAVESLCRPAQVPTV